MNPYGFDTIYRCVFMLPLVSLGQVILVKGEVLTPMRYWFMAFVFVLAIFVRLAFLSRVHPVPATDFEWYYSHGASLAKGLGYKYNGQPTAYFPIGYPLFLAAVFKAFGIGWWSAVLANVVTNSATAVLVYLVAESLWGMTVGFVSGLLMALYVPHIQWSSVICSEILFSFLFLLTVYLWLKSGRRSVWLLVASGVTLGLASWVRPVTLLLPFVYFLGSLIRRHGFWSTLARFSLVSLVMFLTIAPITIRNYRDFHQIVLVSANGGVNLWQGNNPHANGAYYWPEDKKLNPFLDYEANAVQENPIAEHMAIQYIESHPWRTVQMGLVKWGYFFKDVSNIQVWSTEASNPPVSKTFIHNMANLSLWSYIVTYALAGLGFIVDIVWMVRRRRSRDLLMWLAIGYYIALFFFFPAWSRMRAPVSPLVIVFAGLPVGALIQWGASRIRKTLPRPSNTHTRRLKTP